MGKSIMLNPFIYVSKAIQEGKHVSTLKHPGLQYGASQTLSVEKLCAHTLLAQNAHPIVYLFFLQGLADEGGNLC